MNSLAKFLLLVVLVETLLISFLASRPLPKTPFDILQQEATEQKIKHSTDSLLVIIKSQERKEDSLKTELLVLDSISKVQNSYFYSKYKKEHEKIQHLSSSGIDTEFFRFLPKNDSIR